MDQAEFHKRATSYIKNPNDDPEIAQHIEEFKKISTYVPGDYEDGAAFDNLEKHLAEIESHYQSKECNRIFYLALPPSVFIPVAKNLKEHNYVTKGGVNRIIVEKPFGKDLDSARELLGSLKQYWTEDETFVSTIISARRWLRTFSYYDLPTLRWVLAGTRTSSATSRSLSRNLSAPKAGAVTLMNSE